MKRLIVSDVPGTTRETVELDLDYQAEGSERHGNSVFSIPRVSSVGNG